MASHASASASASPGASASVDPRSIFLEFLRSIDYPNREDLYDFFTPSLDFHTTITIHSDRWVPCDLLRYIHKDNRPFSQRLSCFEQIAESIGQYITIEEGHLACRTIKKRKMGFGFLS